MSLLLGLTSLLGSPGGPFPGFWHFCSGISQCYLPESPRFSLWWVFSYQEVGGTLRCRAVADADGCPLSGPDCAFPRVGGAQEWS